MREIIKKLDEAETRIKELEARIPAAVAAAVIMALRDPEALRQLLAISEFKRPRIGIMLCF